MNCKDRFCLAAAVTFCAAVVCGRPASANPTEWPFAVGGNGHFYERILPPDGITWTDADVAADASSFHGVHGHLVTIANEAEWRFVTGTFPFEWTWIGLTDQAQEGNFRWVTGEPLTFTRWGGGEPNDAGGIEDYVFYQLSSSLGGDWGWNDFPNYHDVFTAALPIGYVVEYDAPEPPTMILAALAGGLALAWRLRWKRRSIVAGVSSGRARRAVG